MPPRESAAAASAGQTPEPKSDDTGRVLRRLRQVYTAARSHAQRVERHVGIGGAPLWALGIIHAQPGLGVTALAQEMQVHQSTASNLLRGLVERELVATTRHETDGRAVRLTLTPKGATLLASAPGPVSGLLSQALGRMDRSTLARLDTDLAQLIERMGIGDDAPAPPISHH